MAVCCKHHLELTDGVGRCSVPIWMNGLPAGFCDEVAYGEPTEEGRLKYADHIPGLACVHHGGPKKSS